MNKELREILIVDMEKRKEKKYISFSFIFCLLITFFFKFIFHILLANRMHNDYLSVALASTP